MKPSHRGRAQGETLPAGAGPGTLRRAALAWSPP